jgi:hypothetical protein
VDLTDWLWPTEAEVEWFTAFIAADARHANDETIRSLAAAMLGQRCACVTCWGPDCERVHLLFDDAYVSWPHRIFRRWGRCRTTWSDEILFLLTDDYRDESLPAALSYAARVAWPSGDGYYEDRAAEFRRSRRAAVSSGSAGPAPRPAAAGDRGRPAVGAASGSTPS